MPYRIYPNLAEAESAIAGLAAQNDTLRAQIYAMETHDEMLLAMFTTGPESIADGIAALQSRIDRLEKAGDALLDLLDEETIGRKTERTCQTKQSWLDAKK
jgi:hypothetical protein